MVLTTDSGEKLNDHYLVSHDSETYLLTSEQYKSMQGGSAMPECALQRTNDEE